ncbi:hypothetical protein GJV06_04835 [Enterobacteriaceae bacterium RIT691]|nr:hypothetical protein [Enterobacteriaceae bacterium RIT691]
MKTKLLLKGSFFIAVMVVASLSVGLILQHPLFTHANDSSDKKDYKAALVYMRNEVQQLNQHAVGKQIHKNTRLDSAQMNERDKVVTYQLTLLDVTGQDIDRISDARKKTIMQREKQSLLSKNKDDIHLRPLFLEGWTMEYIQKTNDDEVISAITITGADMAQDRVEDAPGSLL